MLLCIIVLTQVKTRGTFPLHVVWRMLTPWPQTTDRNRISRFFGPSNLLQRHPWHHCHEFPDHHRSLFFEWWRDWVPRSLVGVVARLNSRILCRSGGETEFQLPPDRQKNQAFFQPGCYSTPSNRRSNPSNISSQVGSSWESKIPWYCHSFTTTNRDADTQRRITTSLVAHHSAAKGMIPSISVAWTPNCVRGCSSSFTTIQYSPGFVGPNHPANSSKSFVKLRVFVSLLCNICHLLSMMKCGPPRSSSHVRMYL